MVERICSLENPIEIEELQSRVQKGDLLNITYCNECNNVIRFSLDDVMSPGVVAKVKCCCGNCIQLPKIYRIRRSAPKLIDFLISILKVASEVVNNESNSLKVKIIIPTLYHLNWKDRIDLLNGNKEQSLQYNDNFKMIYTLFDDFSKDDNLCDYLETVVNIKDFNRHLGMKVYYKVL